MVLGMHPATLYPRRSRIAPSVDADKYEEQRATDDPILRSREKPVKSLYLLNLPCYNFRESHPGDARS